MIRGSHTLSRASPRRRRIDRVELLIVVASLIGLMVILTVRFTPVGTAIAVAADSVTEFWAFQRVYGPQRQSRYAEEWMIRDFFHDKRGGTFLDIGANDYRKENNKYYLQSVSRCSGIAIKPTND